MDSGPPVSSSAVASADRPPGPAVSSGRPPGPAVSSGRPPGPAAGGADRPEGPPGARVSAGDASAVPGRPTRGCDGTPRWFLAVDAGAAGGPGVRVDVCAV